VVASRSLPRNPARLRQVSIPFIAGQWSLQPPAAWRRGKEEIMSQSPSLRGSGRFTARAQERARKEIESQSPSLRGSGRFARRRRHGRRMAGVSQSPSLRGSGRFGKPRSARSVRQSSLNPLHCGAVVASNGRKTAVARRKTSLNPLHCGAVVASIESLARNRASDSSQSPSLRGSGRFKSPLPPRTLTRRVSIPFIAGQWSLRGPGGASPDPIWMSQSPSLRGSGRFLVPILRKYGIHGSQSPSLRGSGRFHIGAYGHDGQK